MLVTCVICVLCVWCGEMMTVVSDRLLKTSSACRRSLRLAVSPHNEVHEMVIDALQERSH